MATVTLARSDAFPVGTTVGIYPAPSQRAGSAGPQAPTAAAIATAVVDAAGNLSVTNAGILQGADYVAAASVNGTWQYVRARSTLDKTDAGTGIGVGDTSSGSAALANVAASSGAFAIGQRITGPGIPPGTYLVSGSGASWTMSDKATATALGVALQAEGATPAVTGGKHGGSGQSVVPVTPTRWRARVQQRRAAAGTS
jgi:hypothetical protein